MSIGVCRNGLIPSASSSRTQPWALRASAHTRSAFHAIRRAVFNRKKWPRCERRRGGVEAQLVHGAARQLGHREWVREPVSLNPADTPERGQLVQQDTCRAHLPVFSRWSFSRRFAFNHAAVTGACGARSDGYLVSTRKNGPATGQQRGQVNAGSGTSTPARAPKLTSLLSVCDVGHRKGNEFQSVVPVQHSGWTW
jgi:hypothetical protein